MPWIEVYRDPKVISGALLGKIVSLLPSAVARAFDVPEELDGRLTEKDIEVKTFEFNPYDIHSQPLAIIIRTEEFAARRENLKQRRETVEAAIREQCPENVHGFVWVRPVEGSFGEF